MSAESTIEEEDPVMKRISIMQGRFARREGEISKF